MIDTGSRITSRGTKAGVPVLRRLLPAAAVGAALLLAGCQSSGSGADGGGSSLKNFLLYGGATVPPEMPPDPEVIACPRFDVFEGGSAVRSGEGRSLRYQLAIRTTARECIPQPDGRHTVNVGVEVLALLGPTGGPGTYSAPLRISIKRDNTVLSTRTRQVSITIPAGEAQAMTRIVEEGFPLPEDTSNVLIEIGLGAPRR
ncbi:hypothetical protein FHS82_000283 [Pseudochelatococcus lubricantis]|uniref:Lipoprotein n=1 Tax=Pseudochelatococcus lubricantis TaxID=1538102 RepID=A0ABX0UY02_9HYPH|nr:hypothetical protein [Pseudochelatococcus lubricantis]NIJ56470.1 hypothetical protein [Pseudochelatococcus lubricantis]